MVLRPRNERPLHGAECYSPSSSVSSTTSISSHSTSSPVAAEPSPVAAAAASAAASEYYASSLSQPSLTRSSYHSHESYYYCDDDRDSSDVRRRRPSSSSSMQQDPASASGGGGGTPPPPLLLILVALVAVVPAVLIPSSRYRTVNASLLELRASYLEERVKLDSLRVDLEGAKIRHAELHDDVRKVEKVREGLMLGLADAVAEAATKAEKGAKQQKEEDAEADEAEDDPEVTRKELSDLQLYARKRISSHVEEVYGRGSESGGSGGDSSIPHRIKFDVRFLGPGGRPTSDPLDLASFTVQLAPLHSMPHAVYQFLTTAAELKLWDGAAFVHHTEGRITAVPTDYRTAKSVREKFQEKGMARLIVDDELTQGVDVDGGYVVCYAGDNAAEFYVRLDPDPSASSSSSLASTYRSLGGQGRGREDGARGQEGGVGQHHQDICFGRVVRGRRAVDRIAQRDLRNDERTAERRRINVVGIEGATFLPATTTKNTSGEDNDSDNDESSTTKARWSYMAVNGDGSTTTV